MLLANFADFFYSVDAGRKGFDVATFQYLTPTVLIMTTVSLFFPKEGGLGACSLYWLLDGF